MRYASHYHYPDVADYCDCCQAEAAAEAKTSTEGVNSSWDIPTVGEPHALAPLCMQSHHPSAHNSPWPIRTWRGRKASLLQLRAPPMRRRQSAACLGVSAREEVGSCAFDQRLASGTSLTQMACFWEALLTGQKARCQASLLQDSTGNDSLPCFE